MTVTIPQALQILNCEEQELWWLVIQKKIRRVRLQRSPIPIYGFRKSDIERLKEKP